jgi:hypothetical protein
MTLQTDNIQDIYELTPLQKGLLFHNLYAQELGLYFFHHCFIIRGNLNLKAFEQAWQQVINRHTILRTGFYWEDIDNPLQVVYQKVPVPVHHYDWKNLDTTTQEKQLKLFQESDRDRGFDFAQPCLMRLNLIQLADDYYQLVWSNHHIIIDGWSLPILLQECAQLYTAFCEEKELFLPTARPFQDYINWLQQQDIAKTESFWRGTLGRIKAPTPLTYLKTKNISNIEERYDEEIVSFSTKTTQELQFFATKNRLTIATLVHAAWAIILSRYTCLQEIVYGCTVTGRPVDLIGAESMVGLFINTLPIHVKVNSEEFLLPWLQYFQNLLVEARNYEYTPLTHIQAWSDIPKNTPLFESIVVVEKIPVSQFLKDWQSNIEVEELGQYYKTNYPLTIVVYPNAELTIGISYDFNCFDLVTIQGILQDFQILLQSMIINQEGQLKDLSLLTSQQQEVAEQLDKEMIFDWNFSVAG